MINQMHFVTSKFCKTTEIVTEQNGRMPTLNVSYLHILSGKNPYSNIKQESLESTDNSFSLFDFSTFKKRLTWMEWIKFAKIQRFWMLLMIGRPKYKWRWKCVKFSLLRLDIIENPNV